MSEIISFTDIEFQITHKKKKKQIIYLSNLIDYTILYYKYHFRKNNSKLQAIAIKIYKELIEWYIINEAKTTEQRIEIARFVYNVLDSFTHRIFTTGDFHMDHDYYGFDDERKDCLLKTLLYNVCLSNKRTVSEEFFKILDKYPKLIKYDIGNITIHSAYFEYDIKSLLDFEPLLSLTTCNECENTHDLNIINYVMLFDIDEDYKLFLLSNLVKYVQYNEFIG